MRVSPKLVAVLILTIMAVFASTALGIREDQDPVVISVGVPLSGDWREEGSAILKAVELATEEINESGGLLGRRLLLAINDTEALPLVAAELARSWSEAGTILAHIGGFASAPTIAAQRYFHSAGIVQLSPTVGHAAFAAGSPWSFSMVGLKEGEAKSNARFAFDVLGARNAAVLYRHDEWGRRLAEEFQLEFAALGGDVVSKEHYFETNPRFPELLQRIEKNEPDLVYIVSKEREGVEICRVRPKGSWEGVHFLASSKLHSPRFLQEAGPDAEGLVVSALFAPQNGAPRARSFHRSYLSRYGEEPSLGAALAYDATHLLSDAVTRAGTLDREIVRRTLAETDGWNGVTGRLGFAPEGNALREYGYLTIREGRFAAEQ